MGTLTEDALEEQAPVPGQLLSLGASLGFVVAVERHRRWSAWWATVVTSVGDTREITVGMRDVWRRLAEP